MTGTSSATWSSTMPHCLRLIRSYRLLRLPGHSLSPSLIQSRESSHPNIMSLRVRRIDRLRRAHPARARRKRVHPAQSYLVALDLHRGIQPHLTPNRELEEAVSGGSMVARDKKMQSVISRRWTTGSSIGAPEGGPVRPTGGHADRRMETRTMKSRPWSR